MDQWHDVPNLYKREKMYLKPTDLGPLYKEPILAEVYTVVLIDPKDVLGGFYSKGEKDNGE